MRASNGYEAGLIVDGYIEVDTQLAHNFVLCEFGNRKGRQAPTVQQLADAAASGLFNEIKIRDRVTGNYFTWRGPELGGLIAEARRYRLEEIAEAFKRVQS